tara:strand:- start:1139 stop:1333 length:195 start_codon:yes stop_codon:yes gene_type:complete
MPTRISKEDSQAITHINYICDRIHDFGNDLYEDLMDREHEEAKARAKNLIKELADLIQSMSEEV